MTWKRTPKMVGYKGAVIPIVVVQRPLGFLLVSKLGPIFIRNLEVRSALFDSIEVVVNRINKEQIELVCVMLLQP